MTNQKAEILNLPNQILHKTTVKKGRKSQQFLQALLFGFSATSQLVKTKKHPITKHPISMVIELFLLNNRLAQDVKDKLE